MEVIIELSSGIFIKPLVFTLPILILTLFWFRIAKNGYKF